LKYLDKAGSAPQADSVRLMLERDRDLAQALIEGSWSPVTEHDIAVGSGVFNSPWI
jgi:hypothetical protein